MYQHLADCTEFEVHYVKLYALPDVIQLQLDTCTSKLLLLLGLANFYVGNTSQGTKFSVTLLTNVHTKQLECT